MSLEKLSIHQLRGIAQSYGIQDIFSKTDIQLRQDISLRQQEQLPKVETIVPRPEYDARLMTRPPAKRSNEELVREALQGHVAMGLHIRFDEERWYFQKDKKTDEGSLRMPLISIVRCADGVLK
jgi:hypothetical protein